MDAFLISYFMMVTNLIDYITDSKEFEEEFRTITAGQFEHDSCNKILVLKLSLMKTTLLINESNFGF